MDQGSGVSRESALALSRRAHAVIPGGAHTYAKGDDQYPVGAPFIAYGKGAYVFDTEGKRYIEYAQGARTVTLGHAHPAVNAAVRDALEIGQNFNRPARIEVEAAEAFLALIDSQDMVKFCKDGSTADSDAIRLARAITGRDMVAYCTDHPFFATDDWFIGTTAVNAGIPKQTTDLVAGFRYNDLASLQAVFDAHPGRVAAVILEPCRIDLPKDDFLAKVRDLAHAQGALLVFDEVVTGFRWHKRGAHRLFDVVPDLSTWGKAMGNGFAVSALAGKREFMERGGLYHDQDRVFLVSTTHGAESAGLAAAIATIGIYQREPIIEKLEENGRKLRTLLNEVIDRHGVGAHVKVFGRDQCLFFSTTNAKGEACQGMRSLLLQETLKRGVLCPSLIVSSVHSDADLHETAEAWDGALAVYARALADGYEKHLVGRPSQSVYRRKNGVV